MNLDRFSVPMYWENKKQDSFFDEMTVENEVNCCGCGIKIYVGEEDMVESEIWEDEFLHDDPECIKAYYEKEKRVAGLGNSRH